MNTPNLWNFDVFVTNQDFSFYKWSYFLWHASNKKRRACETVYWLLLLANRKLLLVLYNIHAIGNRNSGQIYLISFTTIKLFYIFFSHTKLGCFGAQIIPKLFPTNFFYATRTKKKGRETSTALIWSNIYLYDLSLAFASNKFALII